MPEGPSLYLLREEASVFRGKTVRNAVGNAKLDLDRMRGRRLKAVRRWGKHLLLEFPDFTLRIHLMMFGSYRIDERKPGPPRLRLEFDKGEISFYTCSARYLEEPLDELYDWSADVLEDAWNPRAARKKLLAEPSRLVCDALLDQNVFAGVGNIIKNEVLFRIGVHPSSIVGQLPSRKLGELIREARRYSFDFLEWKRAYVLKKHWLVHTKRICVRCKGPIDKLYLGVTNRRSFFCPHCQRLHAAQV